MIDLVYLCVADSRYNHIELRMSLRSIARHLSGVGKVYVVGHAPKWIEGVEHMPVSDDRRRVPDYNIMNKIRVFCENYDGDRFLFINDDHFLLQDFEATAFPYFYQGSLQDYVRKRGLDPYGRRANNTLQYLIKNELPVKHFDCHYPIIYDRKKFLEVVVNAVDWTNRDGFIIKSLYTNSLGIEGERIRDYKLNELPPPEARVFSTYPHIKHSIQRFLTDKFRIKSKFEKTDIGHGNPQNAKLPHEAHAYRQQYR